MMKSRPRRRRYAVDESDVRFFALSPVAVATCTSATARRAAHRVPDYDVSVTGAFLKCFEGQVGSDLSQCDCRTRAQLRRLTLYEKAARVENAVEEFHTTVTAKRAVALEEGHFFSQRSVSRLALGDLRFDSRHRRGVAARADGLDRGHAHIAVRIIESALQRLHRTG